MIGVVSEGKSDKGVLEQISQKTGIIFKHRLMNSNDLRKAKSYANILLEGGCNKVIILKDLHSSSQIETEKRFIKAGCKKEVKLCVVVRTIEAWLLSDEQAINDYLNTKMKPVPNPEGLRDPVKSLSAVFVKAKDKSYLKGGKDPVEIAKRMNLNVLGKKCPSFHLFMRLVQE